jgi:hypothetical protein
MAINIHTDSKESLQQLLQTPLNLPPIQLKLQSSADGLLRVYDQLRQKFVALTPEERVRQHFVDYLINTLGYPASLMANEVALKFNGQTRRCDTVLYARGDLRPLAIVEYKAPEVEITQKVFDQIARYNLVMGARLLIVSNGLRHYCCLYSPTAQSAEAQPANTQSSEAPADTAAQSAASPYRFLREIPTYSALLTL